MAKIRVQPSSRSSPKSLQECLCRFGDGCLRTKGVGHHGSDVRCAVLNPRLWPRLRFAAARAHAIGRVCNNGIEHLQQQQKLDMKGNQCCTLCFWESALYSQNGPRYSVEAYSTWNGSR